MSGLEVGSEICACGQAFHQTRLIAVTGGPGAGKTAVLEMALRALCSHVGVLPEAASIVFGGGFPRHDSDVGRRAAQRAIFHVQREVETLVLGERQVAVGLCDRGSLDGAAYWPGSVEDYCGAMGTTLRGELERYAAVIHLKTPAAHQGYNHANSLRIESASEASALDSRILAAWSGHPHRLVIPSDADFLVKATAALGAVRAQLPTCCQAHPLPNPEEKRGMP